MLLKLFKKNWNFVGNYHLMLLKCSKSQNFNHFLLLAECNFSTLINYSTNMCRTSYEPTVLKLGFLAYSTRMIGLN